MIQLPKLWRSSGDHAFLIEIALGDFRIGISICGEIRVIAVEQFAEAWARLIVADDALPFGVAGQLGEELRKVLEKLIALSFLERTDSFFDLLRRAHIRSLLNAITGCKRQNRSVLSRRNATGRNL